MSMDLSSLNSINSLLGSTYGTAAATTPNISGTSFENYLMNALGTGTNSATPAANVSSLLDMYSNGGANSLVNGLTSSGSTSDVASQLLSSLQSTGTSAANLTSLYNTPNTSAPAAYADGLTSTFQSQLLNNMNAAKAKLQSSFNGFIERMGETPNASAQFRIEQMQQNISLIENYIASKSANSTDALLGQLSGTDSTKAATNHSLVDQLDAKSALTQYRLNL